MAVREWVRARRLALSRVLPLVRSGSAQAACARLRGGSVPGLLATWLAKSVGMLGTSKRRKRETGSRTGAPSGRRGPSWVGQYSRFGVVGRQRRYGAMSRPFRLGEPMFRVMLCVLLALSTAGVAAAPMTGHVAQGYGWAADQRASAQTMRNMLDRQAQARQQQEERESQFMVVWILGVGFIVACGVCIVVFNQKRYGSVPSLADYLKQDGARAPRGGPQCTTCKTSHFYLEHIGTGRIHMCRGCGTRLYRS